MALACLIVVTCLPVGKALANVQCSDAADDASDLVTQPGSEEACALLQVPAAFTHARAQTHTHSPCSTRRFTVSGHSSGASMAKNHFVAFSDRIHGLGVCEGAGYGCARFPGINLSVYPYDDDPYS